MQSSVAKVLRAPIPILSGVARSSPPSRMGSRGGRSPPPRLTSPAPLRACPSSPNPAVVRAGPIPCDFDIDLVVPVWLNPAAFGCTDLQRDRLLQPQSATPSPPLRCGKTREQHVDRAGLWLNATFGPRVLRRQDWGGWRVSLAGIGVDFIVSIEDNSPET